MRHLISDAPRNSGLRVGKRPTLNDIARDLGISRATVSNAFNRPEVVAPPLLEKILAHAQSLGYGGPDPMARAMRRREVQEVAVVFHHDLRYALGDAQSVQFLQGVAAELDRRHLSLQLIPKMGRRALLPAAFQTTADALIIHDQVETDLQTQLRMVHKPVVLVDTYLEGMASVGVDDLQGARLAMQHVLSVRPDTVVVMCLPVGDQERARIDQSPYGARSGFVGGARYGGYLQVLLEAGFPLERVTWMEVDDRTPEQAVQRFMPDVTRQMCSGQVGVACMSDRIALAVMQAWPTDVPRLSALVGFDDIPLATASGLTTIRQDSFLKGVHAVQIVLDAQASVQLPCEIIIRST